MVDRRSFLLSLSSSPLLFGSLGGIAENTLNQDRPEPIDPKLVSQFVGRSHGNLDAVKELLTETPALIHASWDWGNGDWETGLGAASHVGRRDIAEYLLENGARIDAFAVAMLGMTSVMKSFIDVQPDIHSVPGPHGIPLLSHAVFGRERALEVFELLIERGADVNGAANAGMTCLMSAAMVGNIEALEVLLEQGADTTAQDSKGQTALDLARSREQTDAIAILEDQTRA